MFRTDWPTGRSLISLFQSPRKKKEKKVVYYCFCCPVRCPRSDSAALLWNRKNFISCFFFVAPDENKQTESWKRKTAIFLVKLFYFIKFRREQFKKLKPFLFFAVSQSILSVDYKKSRKLFLLSSKIDNRGFMGVWLCVLSRKWSPKSWFSPFFLLDNLNNNKFFLFIYFIL